jgi:hypothetical protein
MAGRAAVVNERVTLFRFQELRDIGRADFQFERCGYAVERFHALALYLLAVLVKINESWSYYQPAGMNNPVSAQRLGRDADNLSVTDARPVSGSITRPPSITRSYCCADTAGFVNARKNRKKISLRTVAPFDGRLSGFKQQDA